MLIGLTGFLIGKNRGDASIGLAGPTRTEPASTTKDTPTKKKTWGGVESTLTGHAVLRKTINVSWPNTDSKITDGSFLPPGISFLTGPFR